jgi:hypothetical protein
MAQTVRHVDMLDGVTVSESKAQKDELILEGADIENVSQSGSFMNHPQAALTLRDSQRHLSKAFAECETKIFANSWMASMFLKKPRSLRNDRSYEDLDIARLQHQLLCIFLSHDSNYMPLYTIWTEL